MTVPQEVTLARHAGDLDDDGHEDILTSVTAETDTTLRLAPDGTGGVEWGTGGSGPISLDDLTDVTLTSPAAGDRLRYDGSVWRNSAAVWVPVMVEDGATGLWYVTVTGDGDAVMTEV